MHGVLCQSPETAGLLAVKAYNPKGAWSVGFWLARTIYIRWMYGMFGRKITKYTVIYGVYIRFWPALMECCVNHRQQQDIGRVKAYNPKDTWRVVSFTGNSRVIGRVKAYNLKGAWSVMSITGNSRVIGRVKAYNPKNTWRVVSFTGNSRVIGRQRLQFKGCMQCRV
jgi:hypothetical protein